MSEQTATELLDRGMAGLAKPAPAARTAPARILEYAPGRRLALPIHTTLEIVEDPEIFPVPGIAPFGLGLLNWQDNWIAVIDLAHLLHHTPTPGREKPRYVLALAFQRTPGEPLEYAGVFLPQLPETAFVNDDFFCDLPDDCLLWPQISLSCFSYKEQATPIVDTGRLFGRSYD